MQASAEARLIQPTTGDNHTRKRNSFFAMSDKTILLTT